MRKKLKISSMTKLLENLRERGHISWITVRRAGQFGFNSHEINRDASSRAAIDKQVFCRDTGDQSGSTCFYSAGLIF